MMLPLHDRPARRPRTRVHDRTSQEPHASPSLSTLPAAPRQLTLLITLACAAATATACFDAPDPLPDLPAADAARADPEALPGWRRSAIDLILDGRVWQGARSGYVVLVARDGRLVHARSMGHQDVEAGIPMSMETRFQIASMTKPVIAVAAMILVEEGRLELDDLVTDHLPEFADMRVALLDEAGAVIDTQPQTPPIRVRHLLSFTSGIGPGFDEGPLWDSWEEGGVHHGKGSLAERIDRLPSLPLFEQPGTRWRYGASMDVVARIVEQVAGEPLEIFLERRIFEPLGMKATHYLKDTPEGAPLATMYHQNAEGDLEAGGQIHVPLDWTPGGYGLVSTAPDYMRFALMLWNEGAYDGRRILRAETLRAMRTPEIDSGVLAGMGIEGLGFGLGVSVVTDESKTMMASRAGDFWWSGAYGTHFWVSPESGIVLVVMQQQEMRRGPINALEQVGIDGLDS